MKVWLLERHIPYEPGYIQGAFSSEEKAQASQPGIEWRRGSDGALYEFRDESHLAPQWRGLNDTWSITGHDVDPPANA